MNLVDEAIFFAAKAHSGQIRKLAGTPYILHPLEVASIIGTMTADSEIIAAGLLHDTLEDCDVDPLEISRLFGKRVFALVQSETEDKHADRPPAETWMERKQDSLLVLSHTGERAVKILWLADKLSNIRSFWREHEKSGLDFVNHLHQKDPKMHKWYYDTIADLLFDELGDTPAYKEFVRLKDEIFGDM